MKNNSFAPVAFESLTPTRCFRAFHCDPQGEPHANNAEESTGMLILVELSQDVLSRRQHLSVAAQPEESQERTETLRW